MKRRTQRIGILLILSIKIVYGLWDLVTDIIYVNKAEFQHEYMKILMLFFIIITPFIMLVTWSVTLGRIKLERNKDVKKERIIQEQYLANSEYVLQFLYRTVKTLKVFPFFLIAYTFKKFEVVITPELLKYATQQTTLYKNLMREKDSPEESTEDEVWTYSNGNFNWFIILSFASSVGSVFYNIFILSHWMFDTEIRSFFDLLTCMMESEKGRKEEKVKKVFAFFDIPQKVLITNQQQISKMAQLKPDRYQRIKQLHINLPKNKNSFDFILSDMHKILRNLRASNNRLTSFSLNFSECNMTTKQKAELAQAIRVLKADTKYVNLKQTVDEGNIDFDEGDSRIDRVLNMKISSNIFFFSDEFVLYRVSDVSKMNEIIQFLNAHKIQADNIQTLSVNRNFYVNIHEQEQYQVSHLKTLLNEKEESLVQLNISLNESTRQYHFIDSYPLKFPQYLDSIHYLQINSQEQMDFQQLIKSLLKNLVDSYYQGVIINANLQYNQSASLLELLSYFLQLYKLDANQKIITMNEVATRQILGDNDELEFSNMLLNNDTIALNALSENQNYNKKDLNQPVKQSYLQSILLKEDLVKLTEDTKLNDKMLFQCIKIDDSILIGCSKALFVEDDLLTYLHNEEGNYSCLFIFLEHGISQDFILKLHAQLQEYFEQMNNLRYLHMIIGESGSFFIDLQVHFTYIENVLIFQNDLFQFKVTKNHPDDEEAKDDSIISNKKKVSQIYTYADLVSDTYDTDLSLKDCDPYVKSILLTARKGLDVHKISIQNELQNILQLQDNTVKMEGKFNPSVVKFNQTEVSLPLELPPLSARLLPQALKQMGQVQKFSIYDNVDLDIESFLISNRESLQYLKVKNSKIQRCQCGIKHQRKNSNFVESDCQDKSKVIQLDGVVYRSNFMQLIDISSLKEIKYLNITQSQMYLYEDYTHLVSSLSSLSTKLQVVKLAFQNSNIFLTSDIATYLCNTSILHTFEINAVDNYKFIGLEHILKGLSFNYLIENIGIKLSSHQLSNVDMTKIIELLEKRRSKGTLKRFKFYLKKYQSPKNNSSSPSPQQFLQFFNQLIHQIVNLSSVTKLSLSLIAFDLVITQKDLPNLSQIIFENAYKKLKINLKGNTISNDFNIQPTPQSSQLITNKQLSQHLTFKCDKIQYITSQHLISQIMKIDIPKKILSVPHEVLDQKENAVPIQGSNLYLQITAELSTDLLEVIRFSEHLTKLILDFETNFNLLFEELLQLVQNIQKHNLKELKYLYIITPQQLLGTKQRSQIKQIFSKFKHFSPQHFILK